MKHGAIFFILAIFSLMHPHLWQKMGMLWTYLTHSNYTFWTTFSKMDILDLLLHAGMPIVFFWLGWRKFQEQETLTETVR